MKKNYRTIHPRPAISNSLSWWAGFVINLGTIILIAMIIISLVTCIQGGYVVYDTSTIIPKKKFDFGTFIGLFAPWIIYCLIEYLAYNVIAVILEALGEIVYYTSITASQFGKIVNPVSTEERHSVDLKSWFCKECGSYCTSKFYCDTCGAKKE